MSRVIITPLVLLYSPIGLFLVLIRSLLLIYVFLASAILYTVPPLKRIVLRLMCSFIGFVVTSDGHARGSSKQPLVSNCATLFDHMVLNLLTNCVTPHKFVLSWALTWRPLNYDESDCVDRISDVFHIQPEETPTGPHLPYMLRFNSAPFRLFHTVQPSVHPIDWKYEIFWLLFSPIVRVHVKFLEPMKKSSCDSGKSDELFAESVRHEIAKNLNKRTVDWDSSKHSAVSDQSVQIVGDLPKVLSEQDKFHDSKANENIDICDGNDDTNNSNKQTIPNVDPRIDQVLAVIPDGNPVAVGQLLDELGDVDNVIARLLEQPELMNEVSSRGSTIICGKYLSPSSHRLAADNFSRNTDERHRSFTDRKTQFLENARLRYLEMHPNVKV